MTSLPTILRVMWITVGALSAAVSLPGSIELLLLTLGSFLPRPRAGRYSPQAEDTATPVRRLAVVVPAHNEEANIGGCVASLLSAASSSPASASYEVDIVVIADNCTDGTADRARAAGARVIARHNQELRGKGYALHAAFNTLLPERHQAYLIVDADSEVDPNFLEESVRVLTAGADAVQCRYLVRHPGRSIRTRLMNVAMRAFNVLRPRGRYRLGLSCGIYGNGFGMTRATLEAVPYTAASVVEDLEFHLALVRSGRRVQFVETTTVYGDMPASGKGASSQRARWEGGRLRMMREKAPGLLADVFAGRLTALEPLLELLLQPLALHVLLLLVAVLTPNVVVRAAGLAGLAIVATHVLAAIFLTGGSWADVFVLAAAPFYVIWKILLVPVLVRSSRSSAAWVRTERASDKRQP